MARWTYVDRHTACRKRCYLAQQIASDMRAYELAGYQPSAATMKSSQLSGK
jgi:hypothetical protein